MITMQQAAAELLRRRLARRSFLEFLKYVWWMPHELIVGRHTAEVCSAIDEAIAHYEKGTSTFLDITIPFRHGKSDLVSRALPAYFLGRCAAKDPDIIMSGYGATLVEGFSKDAKNILRSPAYQRLFPGILPKFGSDTNSEWQIDGRFGKVVATGLGGSLTGKGYHLGIIDDFCKSRAEAESPTYRENTWNAFCNDFMTRRAPTAVTIVCATSWHQDDVRGRIHAKMKLDEEFPQFKIVHFSATNPDGTYLFTERYDAKWYRSQYATLGRYASAGLLDGNPIPADGNVAKREWFQIVPACPVGHACRGWDCAASTKTTADFTAGVRMVRAGNSFYITNIFQEHVAAPSVLQTIHNIATHDGKETSIVLEEEGGSAGKIVSASAINKLVGYDIRKIKPTGDKLTRALGFLAQAEAGNVFLQRAAWNDKFLNELLSFPNGTHDDMVDASVHAFNQLASPNNAGGW